MGGEGPADAWSGSYRSWEFSVGHLREKRPVEFGGEICPALLYRMREPLRPARPSPAYAETLRTGYRDFGLPGESLEAALREAEAAG